MLETLTVLLINGSSGKITGRRSGPFLVHQTLTEVYCGTDEFPCWSVTHVKSTIKFPWTFMTEEAALAFCNDVLPIMRWNEVEAALDQVGERKAKWVSNGPSDQQHDLVIEAAAKRGGFRARVVISA